MAFCSQAELTEVLTEAELIRLTDDEDTGNVNAARVTSAINQADTLIKVYARAQHADTMDEWTGDATPAMVKQLSIFFTSYYLWKRRRKGQVDEEREAAYKTNMQILKDVRDQKIYLDDPESFANTAAIIYTNKDTDDKVYTDDELAKF